MAAIGGMNSGLLAEADRYIRERFGAATGCESEIAVPENSFDVRRKQFSSIAFMLALTQGFPGGADRFIGLTECDLFIPMLTFVFGQAQLNGRVALVSLARLRQEFYGMTPDPELLRFRMKKEIGHELGHSFGLIHCADRGCVMSLATSIQEVDQKSAGFCAPCSRRLPPRSVEPEIEGKQA
jgi:archaemetzincin